MANSEAAPMSLEGFVLDKEARAVLAYLGSRRAVSPDDAIGVVTVSEEVGISESRVNYVMERLRASGFAARDDSGFLYLTPDRGMNVHRKIYGLKKDFASHGDGK